jgi:hypothetical protein
MATEEILITAKLNLGSFSQSIQGMKQEIRALQGSLGDNILSPQDKEKVILRIADLKDEMRDLNVTFNSIDRGNTFQNISTAMGPAIAGLSLLTSSAALFGSENKQLNLIMQKTSAIIAIVSAAQQIADAQRLKGLYIFMANQVKAIGLRIQEALTIKVATASEVALNGAKATGTILTRAITTAQLAWNAAIASNPIGAILTAIALLVTAIVVLVKEYGKAETGVKNYEKALDGTIIKSDDARKAHNEAIIELQKLSIEYDVLTKKIDSFAGEIETLKLEHTAFVEQLKKDTEKEVTTAIEDQITLWGRVKNTVLNFGDAVKGTTDLIVEEVKKTTPLYEEMATKIEDSNKILAEKIKAINKKKEDDDKKKRDEVYKQYKQDLDKRLQDLKTKLEKEKENEVQIRKEILTIQREGNLKELENSNEFDKEYFMAQMNLDNKLIDAKKEYNDKLELVEKGLAEQRLVRSKTTNEKEIDLSNKISNELIKQKTDAGIKIQETQDNINKELSNNTIKHEDKVKEFILNQSKDINTTLIELENDKSKKLLLIRNNNLNNLQLDKQKELDIENLSDEQKLTIDEKYKQKELLINKQYNDAIVQNNKESKQKILDDNKIVIEQISSIETPLYESAWKITIDNLSYRWELYYKELEDLKDHNLATTEELLKSGELTEVEAKNRSMAINLQYEQKIKEAKIKAWNESKRYNISKVIMDGIVAISKTFAELGWPAGIGPASAMGATTLGEVAVLSSENPPIMQKGGWIKGKKHSNGGEWINAEDNEYMVNADAMANPINASLIESINKGGSSIITINKNDLKSIVEGIISIPVVVSETDISNTQRKVKVIEDNSKIR